MKNDIGCLLMTIAGVFGFAETIYFGNNLLPNTKGELICDGIALVVFLIGLLLFKSKR
jgi:hypothetical protein